MNTTTILGTILQMLGLVGSPSNAPSNIQSYSFGASQGRRGDGLGSSNFYPTTSNYASQRIYTPNGGQPAAVQGRIYPAEAAGDAFRTLFPPPREEFPTPPPFAVNDFREQFSASQFGSSVPNSQQSTFGDSSNGGFNGNGLNNGFLGQPSSNAFPYSVPSSAFTGQPGAAGYAGNPNGGAYQGATFNGNPSSNANFVGNLSAVQVGATNTGGRRLIPRRLLFGDADFEAASLSRDGRLLGYLAPYLGRKNVHVITLPDNFVAGGSDLPNGRPVTMETGRSVAAFEWMWDNRSLIYVKDGGGDENFLLTSLDVLSGEERQLSPEGSLAFVSATTHLRPFEIVVSVNDRNPVWHDPYLVNYRTGQRRLIMANNRFKQIMFDLNLTPRLGVETPEDGSDVYMEIGANGTSRVFRVVRFADVMGTMPLTFDASGRFMYWIDSTRTDLGEFVRIDVQTKNAQTIHRARKAQMSPSSVSFDPTTMTPLIIGEEYEKLELFPIGTAVAPDLAYLSSLSPGGALSVLGWSLDLGLWIVMVESDVKSPQYFLYDRRLRRARFLFSERGELDRHRLAPMTPIQVGTYSLTRRVSLDVEIPSRDGLVQLCYLTTAPSGVRGPPALVLTVHGGPWARDSWGLDPRAQLWADRGYSTLQCNFRGSSGFGKRHLNLGNREWGVGRMQSDLVDAVAFAVRNRLADPNKVAIAGSSYGGYATLAGLAFTPSLFACGVDLVGPSSLATLSASVPPYWQPAMAEFRLRVGDGRTAQGQGANDPRVKAAESEQIVAAMRANGQAVSYLLFPDEGHGFSEGENELAFTAAAEAFLQQCLGGAAEQFGDLSQSSMVVREPGTLRMLRTALPGSVLTGY